MNAYKADRVISGTWGEIWVDNDYLAEASGIEAKVSISTEAIPQCRNLAKGYKVTGIECSGTLTLQKVTSYFMRKMSDCIKAGRPFTADIITKLDDPGALGAERIKLIGCVFTEMSLANWERDSLGEESIPFNFEGWEIIDSIEA
jgi:hypothetical protein